MTKALLILQAKKNNNFVHVSEVQKLMSALNTECDNSLQTLLEQPAVSEKFELKANKKGVNMLMRPKKDLILSPKQFEEWSDEEQMYMMRNNMYRNFPPLMKIDRADQFEPCLRVAWQQLIKHPDDGVSAEMLNSAISKGSGRSDLGRTIMQSFVQCSACQYTDNKRSVVRFSSAEMTEYNHFRSCIERFIITKVRQGTTLEFAPKLWQKIFYKSIKNDDTVFTLQRLRQFCIEDINKLLADIKKVESQSQPLPKVKPKTAASKPETNNKKSDVKTATSKPETNNKKSDVKKSSSDEEPQVF